jgi:biopolymer transport protein TolR
MALNPSRKTEGGRVSLAEINVTPLVDVMLVLLIVFMVSAPLLQQGIEVKLPKADAGSLEKENEPLLLTIKAGGSIELEQKPVTGTELTSKLTALVAARPELQLLVQADERVNYGTVARVMAQVKKAKITRVGLVTAPEDSNSGVTGSP